MAEKQIKGVIIPRHGTALDWSKAVNFVPKDAELIIYTTDSETDITRGYYIDQDGNRISNVTINNKTYAVEPSDHTRFKFGNGKDNVNVLPFATTDAEGYATEAWVQEYVSMHGGSSGLVSLTRKTVTGNTVELTNLYSIQADLILRVTDDSDAVVSGAEISLYNNNDELIAVVFTDSQGAIPTENIEYPYTKLTANNSTYTIYAEYDTMITNTTNSDVLVDLSEYVTKEELNSKLSASLKREVADDFVTPDIAEDNTIYMVPDPNATEDNNYLEYIKTKHKYSVANGQDYIYAKDESEFSIILLRNGLFVTMVGDDYIDRPEGVHITFNGFNPINEIQEDITVTVDSVASNLKSCIIDLEFNGQSAIVNLGDGSNEWGATPDDDVMKSFGYIYRSQISYEIFSERESMELIGSTAVDLSAYATKTYVGNVVNSAIDKTYSASVNKNSQKAQSGVAVAAAITDNLKTIKSDISSLKSQISSKLSRKIVESLPNVEQSSQNTIYMLKNNSNNVDNIYDEYLPVVIESEPITFNNVSAVISFTDTGDNIEDDEGLSIENAVISSIEISSSDGENPDVRFIYLSNSEHFIRLNINEIDESLSTLIDEIMNFSGGYNKYPSISYSGYSNIVINSLSFNINDLIFEPIGSTETDLSDYATKGELQSNLSNKMDTFGTVMKGTSEVVITPNQETFVLTSPEKAELRMGESFYLRAKNGITFEATPASLTDSWQSTSFSLNEGILNLHNDASNLSDAPYDDPRHRVSIRGVATPQYDDEAANKGYVDTKVEQSTAQALNNKFIISDTEPESPVEGTIWVQLL